MRFCVDSRIEKRDPFYGSHIVFYKKKQNVKLTSLFTGDELQKTV